MAVLARVFSNRSRHMPNGRPCACPYAFLRTWPIHTAPRAPPPTRARAVRFARWHRSHAVRCPSFHAAPDGAHRARVAARPRPTVARHAPPAARPPPTAGARLRHAPAAARPPPTRAAPAACRRSSILVITTTNYCYDEYAMSDMFACSSLLLPFRFSPVRRYASPSCHNPRIRPAVCGTVCSCAVSTACAHTGVCTHMPCIPQAHGCTCALGVELPSLAYQSLCLTCFMIHCVVMTNVFDDTCASASSWLFLSFRSWICTASRPHCVWNIVTGFRSP